MQLNKIWKNITSFKIDVRIVGDEYREKDFTGRMYCEAKGIELYFNTRDHRFFQVQSLEGKFIKKKCLGIHNHTNKKSRFNVLINRFFVWYRIVF